MARFWKILAFIFLWSLARVGVAEPRIALTEGSLFIQGSLALDYSLVGFKTNKQQLSLASDIGGGFFVVDNLSVGLSLPGKWAFIPAGSGEFGISFFGAYYFDINSIVFPYLGLSATPSYRLSDSEFLLHAGVSTGVLISMSEPVALDLGIAPKMYFPLNDKQVWKLQIPAGFIGVRAFF